MKRVIAGVATLAFALPATGAWAWGAQGHQYVGGVTERMLQPEAFAKMNRLLANTGGYGVNLGVAAVWADCIRDVEKKPNGDFVYQPGPRTPRACNYFNTPAGRARMEDYARRNWTNCDYGSQGCAASYHFVNLALQRDRYVQWIAGTNDHDVVHAVNAAIAKLEGRPVPAPFSIKDDTEALLLLAHFVGDLHQPLHVGSVYLRQDGSIADPDAAGGGSGIFMTRGGNSLEFGSSNMHSDWDGIPSDWGVVPQQSVVVAALRLPISGGSIDEWPSAWARESLLSAQGAFRGVSFGSGEGSNPKWPARFADRNAYVAAKTETQRDRLMRGGARFAQVLNTVWSTDHRR